MILLRTTENNGAANTMALPAKFKQILSQKILSEDGTQKLAVTQAGRKAKTL